MDLKIPTSPNLENGLIETPNEADITPNVLLLPTTDEQLLAGWAAGVSAAEAIGHLFTADLMRKAVNPPYEAYYGDGTRASNLIENSSVFRNDVLAANAYKFSKTKIVPIKGSGIYTSGELGTALRRFDWSLNVEWTSSRGAYHYYGFITDLYDFDYEWYKASIKGFAAGLGNNYATLLLNRGLIKDYNIRIYVNGYY